MAIAFPQDLRPYHLDQLIDYITDSGHTSILDRTDIATLRDQLLADIEDPDNYDDPTEAKTFYDPRCSGSGQYPLSNDTGDSGDDATIIHCVSCDGWGKTAVENTPTIVRVWPE